MGGRDWGMAKSYPQRWKTSRMVILTHPSPNICFLDLGTLTFEIWFMDFLPLYHLFWCLWIETRRLCLYLCTFLCIFSYGFFEQLPACWSNVDAPFFIVCFHHFNNWSLDQVGLISWFLFKLCGWNVEWPSLYSAVVEPTKTATRT